MIISVKKFGTILVSRPAGKEAFLAFQPTLKDVQQDEKIIVDFEGVHVLAPSWADEFLIPLRERYNQKIEIVNGQNQSIIETLAILNWYGTGV